VTLPRRDNAPQRPDWRHTREPQPTVPERAGPQPEWPEPGAANAIDRATRGTRRGLPAVSVDSIRSAAGPVLSIVGLVVVGWLTFALLTGDVSAPGATTGGAGPAGLATPAPSNVVIVAPRVTVPGSIVYVKAGNVWIQSDKSVRQLTTSGTASMASWSPDGKSIFYVDSATGKGLAPIGAGGMQYTMTVPTVMRIAADGSGQAEKVHTGRVTQGRYTWAYWIRDPVLSPNGRTLAMASDARNPTTSDVVIQLLDLQTGKLTKPKLPENSPLGHQDPAWSADGRVLLYVKNARDGARGTPAIYRYDIGTGKTTALTGPGYLSPSWSRDGRFVAATRTDSFGTNVVILDARTGTELERVTSDGDSWSPVWSPKGDAIAYLHVEGQIIDLRMVSLTGEGPNWTLEKAINLTEVSGLDGASHPGWFISASDLPALPTPTQSGVAGESAPASAAASPSGAP
jgi:dipeptidyl aminopeptidase/acylaminoacyl peptidase